MSDDIDRWAAIPPDPYADVPHPAELAEADDKPTLVRTVQLTPASGIKPRPVRWLWDQRIAVGTLTLIAGPEGLGKSSVSIWVAAAVTRGLLPGEFLGTPRGVMIAASEDSWPHTIVPRLIAAGADLLRVYRVDVLTVGDDLVGELNLPRDLKQVGERAIEHDVALMLLDPLTSRLDAGIDSHKDAEVRRALEPLAALADRTRMAVTGLMHHNKSGSSDPLQAIMASRAFTAVARSVHTVIRDPEDPTESRRLFGSPKNNLGSTDAATLSFTIVDHEVPTDEGPAHVGRLVWGDTVAGSIGDALRRSGDTVDRSSASEAADWLDDYLKQQGGRSPSATIIEEGKSVGHSRDLLQRARKSLGLVTESVGFPRTTVWCFPETQSLAQLSDSRRGEFLTTTTTTTGQTGRLLLQSSQLSQSSDTGNRPNDSDLPNTPDSPDTPLGIWGES